MYYFYACALIYLHVTSWWRWRTSGNRQETLYQFLSLQQRLKDQRTGPIFISLNYHKPSIFSEQIPLSIQYIYGYKNNLINQYGNWWRHRTMQISLVILFRAFQDVLKMQFRISKCCLADTFKCFFRGEGLWFFFGILKTYTDELWYFFNQIRKNQHFKMFVNRQASLEYKQTFLHKRY